MKPLWKGTISFGLVTIPIQLFSAIQEHVLGFKNLCATCHHPLEYRRWCATCKKDVAWTDVVKGLEVKKGEYVILTQEKIKELRPETTNTVEIIEFVSSGLIAPIYYENHYYSAPTDPKKAQAFSLFKKVLEQTGKAAIGKFVMREKEYVCALQAYEKGILLSTLNYAYEIRSIEKIEALNIKEAKSSPAELKLAQQLIASLTKKQFDISAFKDTFAEKLKKIIKSGKKQKIKQPKESEKKAKPKREQSSLASMLRESLEHARA